MKKRLSEQKQFDIVRSIQMIGVMAKMIDVEFHQHIVDTKFRNPIINNHARKIKESTEQIIKLLTQSGALLKDQEKFDYEYVLNLYKIFEHVTQMSYEQISEQVKRLEE